LCRWECEMYLREHPFCSWGCEMYLWEHPFCSWGCEMYLWEPHFCSWEWENAFGNGPAGSGNGKVTGMSFLRSGTDPQFPPQKQTNPEIEHPRRNRRRIEPGKAIQPEYPVSSQVSGLKSQIAGRSVLA